MASFSLFLQLFWLAFLAPRVLSIPFQKGHNQRSNAAAAGPSILADRGSEPTDLPRLAIYFQTTHDQNGNPISMLPLITEKGIALTHLIVCSFHINENGQIHLNDYPPSDPHFATLWNETEVLQRAGVRVMGMVGGAAAGSFTTDTLDGDNVTFSQYYGQLHDAIMQFGLQGMDLDVEQSMSQAGIERLVGRLHADFGPGFSVTLAPVASALGGTDDSTGANLSGFNYAQLEAADGAEIAFYNAQFYNGFGSMATPDDYEAIVSAGWSPAKVLMGQITTPSAGGDYVPFDQLNQTVIALRAKYGTSLGGIMGWEYFNSDPGGTAAPWEWAQEMTAILRPGQVPQLSVTVADASRLEAAWKQSVIVSGDEVAGSAEPDVNYMGLVNV